MSAQNFSKKNKHTNKNNNPPPLIENYIPTFIVDLSIPINVCFSDHFIHLFISQLLTKVCHHMAQLSSTDVAIPILRNQVSQWAPLLTNYSAYVH